MCKQEIKKYVIAIVAAAALFTTGCGGEEEKVIEGSVQNIEAEDITGDETAGEGGTTGNADGQESNAGNEAAGDQSGSAQKGYLFTANGVTVAMDAEAGPLVEQLGEPASYFEAASCAFEGLDKIYTYIGFELNTYPMGDKDFVSTVVIRDDSVTTGEGITIGSTLEQVQQAYPGESTQEEGMVVYEKDGMKLCFILQNNEVISIEYRSAVLEE